MTHGVNPLFVPHVPQNPFKDKDVKVNPNPLFNNSPSNRRLVPENKSFEQDVANNPELKELLEKVMKNVGEQSPETQFSMNRIIVLLIGLSRALQDAAVVMADRLKIVTERLTGYSHQLTQIPVVLKGEVLFSNTGADDKEKAKNDADERATVNAKFNNMIESVRAHKGLDEDKAKKIQTLMQMLKDMSASGADFTTTFIDIIRNTNSKLFH